MQPLFDIKTAGPVETGLFIVLALAIVGFALLTITRHNPVTAVMSLVATFFATAALYATLDAHFVAVLQVLVYAGAIMVLFIFVVMILNRDEVQPVALRGIVGRVLGLLAGAYVIYKAVWVVWNERATAVLAGGMQPVPAGYGTVAGMGLSLFRDFVFPFEAISLLLLVAIVGGVIVSRSAHTTELAEERVRRLETIRAQAHPEIKLLPGGGAAPDDDAHAAAGHH